MARINTPSEDADKPEIARSDVLAFFEKRSRRIEELGPLRAVIYQDKHPDLAERRDHAEKERVMPLLELDGKQRLLDLGCGSGRWAEALAPSVSHYHGIDLSHGLVEYARGRFKGDSHMRFSVGSVDAFSLASLGEDRPFDRVLCSGVLIYLNDEEVLQALTCIARACAPGSVLVFREPLAVETRLSIVQHYSDELEQEYNAIYRTQAELEDAMANAMGPAFTVTDSGEVYPDAALNNRVETRQRWLKLVRREHP
jgi:ubiquinone/menaquinone biosynthesis C-methylase UbiE